MAVIPAVVRSAAACADAETLVPAANDGVPGAARATLGRACGLRIGMVSDQRPLRGA
ncbi:MAG: hypothetical protein H0U03_00650 [Actinobacteria bacterium]|nr:hypothetical protein [Actinomycetota bacterium]